MQWSGTNTREKLETVGTFFISIIVVRLFAPGNMPLLNSVLFCHKLSLVFKSSVTRNTFHFLLQWGIVLRFHRNIFIIDYVASGSWGVSTKKKRKKRGGLNHNLFSPPPLSLFICSRPNFLNEPEPARKPLLLRLSLSETFTIKVIIM